MFHKITIMLCLTLTLSHLILSRINKVGKWWTLSIRKLKDHRDLLEGWIHLIKMELTFRLRLVQGQKHRNTSLKLLMAHPNNSSQEDQIMEFIKHRKTSHCLKLHINRKIIWVLRWIRIWFLSILQSLLQNNLVSIINLCQVQVAYRYLVNKVQTIRDLHTFPQPIEYLGVIHMACKMNFRKKTNSKEPLTNIHKVSKIRLL